jgi:D-sedoheptulose 7-phosphate isomerase
MDKFINDFLLESIEIIKKIDQQSVLRVVRNLARIKQAKGRIFLCGSGGGAGHASHAACDFRKLLGIESYSVTDNVSELTARINDESWESSYVEWMKVSNLNEKDGVFIFSVGGGDKEAKISMQLVSVMDYAKSIGASVMGVAGRSGGHLSKTTENCVIIPEMRSSSVTAQTEGFQALIWHMLLGHPELGGAIPKWESYLENN